MGVFGNASNKVGIHARMPKEYFVRGHYLPPFGNSNRWSRLPLAMSLRTCSAKSSNAVGLESKYSRADVMFSCVILF